MNNRLATDYQPRPVGGQTRGLTVRSYGAGARKHFGRLPSQGYAGQTIHSRFLAAMRAGAFNYSEDVSPKPVRDFFAELNRFF